MKYLVLLFAAWSFAISSDDVVQAGFNNLSESQKADVIKAVQAQSNKPDSGSTVVEQVDKWADVGIKVGRAMGSCAKELNLAVNDFLKTPAGKLTFIMIGWKIMASDIIHMFGGLIFLLIGIVVSWKFYKNWTISKVKFDPEKKDIFRRPIKTYEHTTLTGDEAGAICGILALAMAIAAACIYTM
jgi:hypothetical protein